MLSPRVQAVLVALVAVAAAVVNGKGPWIG
jgi:hypothetical protein